ncbi:MAG: class I SAM-dependent methyltransferase, partial [Thermoplasmata archaeon]|nr:class I SAM-dependent methyltransferase [Thermoplasmata archaeon]
DPGRVLDVGCNGSILDKYLEENGFTCVCADIDPEGAYYWNRIPRDNFVQVDCRHPPKEWKGAFDYITIISTMEHFIIGEEEELIVAMEQCLSPGGKILITVPFSENSSDIPILKKQGQWPVWCYNEVSMRVLGEKAGLSLVSWMVYPGGNLPIFCAELKKDEK